MKRNMYGLLLLGALFGAYSCSDSSNGGTGTDEPIPVAFYLTDAPATGYKSVTVDVQSMSYSIDSATWRQVPITPTRIDLMRLTNGTDTLLSNLVLNAGERVGQIRLVLGSNNTVTLSNGQVLALDTPSAQQSGLKVNVQSTADATSGYKVVVDFDAARSIVARGNGTYLLKPVLRAYIEANTSAIYGTILPAKPALRVFAVTASGDTVSTVSDTLKSNYFRLQGLLSGSYTVRFESLDSTLLKTNASIAVVGGTDVNLGAVSVP